MADLGELVLHPRRGLLYSPSRRHINLTVGLDVPLGVYAEHCLIYGCDLVSYSFSGA